jgi:GH25 family lysozyme M1 (1,4-beta-N-acetylmuramidase)
MTTNIARGIDVSAYQGTQDWAALARGGLTFAFAKASEGRHSRDGRFAGHISGIIAAGLVPGAYHYGWPSQDPAAEAANYAAAVRAFARRGFLHILDLERRSDGANYGGRTALEIRVWAETWIAAVRAAYPGQRVLVYTSADDITADRMPRTADALWYPAYPSGPMTYTQAEAHARPTPSGLHPLFWQFTSTPVDRSIAYLSPADLRAWAAGKTPTPQQETDMTPAQEAKLDKLIALAEGPGNLTYRNEIADAASVAAGHGHIPDVYGYDVSTYTGVQQLLAKVAALTATVAALTKGGSLTADQITAAAKAGADAALAELGHALDGTQS